MSNSSFYNGIEYARDYILSSITGLQNETRAGNWREDPEYQAYQKVYDLVKDKFGDMFTEFKG